MSTYLVFALIGLGAGAVYAGLAQGLLVVYKGTGIVNFAQGAMAMWGAYVFSELRSSGDLVFPIVAGPTRVHVGDDVPVATALALGVASTALLALAIHLVVFRPLRAAPALAKVVASVGVMLTLQAIATLEFGSEQRVVQSFLPSGSIVIAGLAVPVNRFYLAGIAVATATLLWAWFRLTRIGLATRAAAENERAALLAGYSADRLAAVAWLLSGALAGMFGILVAPLTGLNTVNFTLFVVPALAAAVVGRFTSFGATCAAGLMLGVAQSELLYLQTQSWYPDWAVAGATEAIPFLLIIVALVALGRNLPSRGAVEPERLPEAFRPKRVLGPALVLGAAAAVLLVVLDGGYRYGLIQSLVLAILMLSFVLLTGLVGQISLAQAAFAGIAGFTLSKLGTSTGIPFPLSMLLAAGAATVLGVITALPALRIRGAQLAVVTLGVAVATEAFIFNNPSFTPLSGNLIPDPTLAGRDLGILGERGEIRATFGFLALVVLLLVAVGVANIARGGTGRRLLAVRSNERAAAASGVNPAATKLLAFALSAFIAGIGGAMLGYSRGQLSAASFDAFSGIELLVFAYLGGITSVTGALVAGLIAPLGLAYVVLNRVLDLGGYYLLMGGISVIAVTILHPEGIDGAVRRYLGALYGALTRRGSGDKALETRPERGTATPQASTVKRPRVVAPHADSANAALLEVNGLTVSYGAQRAVDDVSMRIEEGTIVGLIGPNGAGKTSLVDALTGFVPYTGKVRFDGTPLDGAPHARCRRGLARTWQSLELFGDLTVQENLLVAAERPTIGSFLLDLVHPNRSGRWDDVRWAIELVGLEHLVGARPSAVSIAQQKLVGVARALASGATLVLLDEPAAGLDPNESRVLGQRFQILTEQGISVLVIDHDVDLLLGVCDYVYVLDFGRVVAAGTPHEIRHQEHVIDAYLGRRRAVRHAPVEPKASPLGDPAP